MQPSPPSIFQLLLLEAALVTAAANKLVSGLPGFADGEITGAGVEREDKILARLSNGEFVVNAKSTKQYFPLLKAINNRVNKDAINSLVTNSSTESLISAMAREFNTQSVDQIGSTQPDLVSAIREAFGGLVLPKIKGKIDNDVIRLSFNESMQRLDRNTIQI